MDLLAEAYDRGKAAKRNATATSILDVGATVGLFVGTVFWNNLFWLLIAPTGLVEMLLSVALAGGYALILPMLLSLLAPSTPAGMALAETRYKTWGHGIAVAAALYMSFHAFTVVWAWWRSRPAVVETGQDLYLAIGTLIIFIVVPALSWVQIAPDRWVAEIIQAQQVKRLKAAQQANIMAAQIQYARAMALLKRGLANATAEERGELAQTLIAMQRAENEAIYQVADQMRIVTGVDTGVKLLDDPEVERQYHALTETMEQLYTPINEVEYAALPPQREGVAAQRYLDYVAEQAPPALTPRQQSAPPPLPPWDGAELPAPQQDARPAPSPPPPRRPPCSPPRPWRASSRRVIARRAR